MPRNARLFRGLLVHGGALGDFVMSLRTVEALRRAGATEITVLGRASVATLAIGAGGVNRVLDLETGGFHRLFADDAGIPPEVKRRLAGHQVAVDLLGGQSPAFVARLAAATGGRVISLDPRPRPDWTGHVSDQWLADLRSAGFDANVGAPRLTVPEARRTTARAELARLTGRSPVALIHPGSGGRQKCWPLDRFVRLARLLQATGVGAAMLIGPVEVELWPENDLAMLAGAAPLIRDKRLDEAAALLAAADVFVGNDSGISHLAAAVGTATIAIFGATEPRTWRPLGDHVRVVADPKWPSVDQVISAAGGLLLVTELNCR